MRGSTGSRLVAVLSSSVLLGIVSGVIWWQLAEPGRWEMRDVGLVLTEEASRGQFGVVVVFTLVGAIASLIWAVVATLVLRGLGWEVTVVAMVGAVVAGVVAWRVGVHLGPPSPASVKGLAIGDTAPARLEVDNVAPFVVWPIAALVGVLLAGWGQGRPIDASTASVIDTRS